LSEEIDTLPWSRRRADVGADDIRTWLHEELRASSYPIAPI
jgi:hypothetical protein